MLISIQQFHLLPRFDRMPVSKKAPLHRLLNKKEIKPLLQEFEVLLPGYRLSIVNEGGQILVGFNDLPRDLLTLYLQKTQAGHILEYKNHLVHPLIFESQTRGLIIAQQVVQDIENGILEVRKMLSCLNRSLILILGKAIETRDLVDETVERYREINLLYHIGETIGTCLDPVMIPELVIHETNRCIQSDAGLVMLKSDNPDQNLGTIPGLEIVASFGGKELIEKLQQESHQLIMKVIDSEQPTITTHTPDLQLPFTIRDPFAVILCVPLQSGDRIHGVIILGRFSGGNQFTAGEMKLLTALGSQASIALETVRLHLEEVKKQRLDEELAISRQIQLSLLPGACPSVSGWEFAAQYQAARHVGGDLFDFIQIPNQKQKIGLVIADVAGKGIPAALFMAFCRTIIRMQAMTESTPAQVMESTNQLILQDSRSHLFITAFFAFLNLQNGNLVFANGGQNPPIWFQAKTGKCQELTSYSKLLGLFENIHLEERQVKILPKDFLVFYTDGITEAKDQKGHFFGEERLFSSILANKDSNAKGILQGIIDATNNFIGKASQSDDFTLFVIKRKMEIL